MKKPLSEKQRAFLKEAVKAVKPDLTGSMISNDNVMDLYEICKKLKQMQEEEENAITKGIQPKDSQ